LHSLSGPSGHRSKAVIDPADEGETMRVTILIILAMGFAGCAETPPPGPYAFAPPGPYALAPTVGYNHCGQMAALRNNLTATPYPSPDSNALLEALGVRCIGSAYSTIHARY
jgi:hypothetical protein